MLHPQAQAAVAAAADDLSPGDPGYDIDAQRERVRRFNLAQPREEVAVVSDLDADGVRVRMYQAHQGDGARGVIVHLHGGGFVLNDIDVHDRVCRAFAHRSGRAVLSVDYRRPPEHPFPAAPQDVDVVLDWLRREGRTHGLTGPWVAHGDSAGGNLALVAALRNPGSFAALALIYPFIDAGMSGSSYGTEAEFGFGLPEARWYWEQYAGGADRLAELVSDPDFSPLDSPALATLPPTLVVSAEHDILRSEAETLALRIQAAGGRAVATRYLGQIHGFWRHLDVFDAAEPLLGQVAGFVRQHTGD